MLIIKMFLCNKIVSIIFYIFPMKIFMILYMRSADVDSIYKTYLSNNILYRLKILMKRPASQV